MAVIREINIDGRQVPFMASARTPRLYRQLFNKDIVGEMENLAKRLEAVKETGEHFELLDLSMFENIAYVMAKQADPTIPDTADEWLDDFNVFSIYVVLPELVNLWQENMMTLSKPKKK